MNRLQREKNRRDRVLVALNGYAEVAIDEQRHGDALRYLILAQAIQRSDRREQQLQQLQSRIEELGSVSPASERRRQQMADYGRALEQRDWLAARAQLAQMANETPGDPGIAGLQQELDAAIDDIVSQDKQKGEALYSAGDIETALLVWQEALDLRPEDTQLQNNIDRAQRILDKIRSLQNDEGE